MECIHTAAGSQLQAGFFSPRLRDSFPRPTRESHIQIRNKKGEKKLFSLSLSLSVFLVIFTIQGEEILKSYFIAANKANTPPPAMGTLSGKKYSFPSFLILCLKVTKRGTFYKSFPFYDVLKMNPLAPTNVLHMTCNMAERRRHKSIHRVF